MNKIDAGGCEDVGLGVNGNLFLCKTLFSLSLCLSFSLSVCVCVCVCVSLSLLLSSKQEFL